MQDIVEQMVACLWLKSFLSANEVVAHEIFSYSDEVYLDQYVFYMLF
jgi:hypothetical protein